VYSLFEVLTTAIGTKIDVYYDDATVIIDEFSDFAEKVLNLSTKEKRKTFDAHFNRVGVTNAADRGLDMYANFGSVVQIKHLSLDEKLAEDIVTSITSNRIIIVCKSSEKSVINSLLSQIGWRSRIQSIITIEEIVDWYNKALRGIHSITLGDRVLMTLANEIKSEFPSVGNQDFINFKTERKYDIIQNADWSL
jgi:type II restriction enzyme